MPPNRDAAWDAAKAAFTHWFEVFRDSDKIFLHEQRLSADRAEQ